MIGLSLSFCIKDICSGKVNEDDVEYIVSGIECPDDETWNKIMDAYTQYYWYDFPDRAVELATKMYRNNRIEQPRLNGEQEPSIVRGHWVSS